MFKNFAIDHHHFGMNNVLYKEIIKFQIHILLNKGIDFECYPSTTLDNTVWFT